MAGTNPVTREDCVLMFFVTCAIALMVIGCCGIPGLVIVRCVEIINQ